ncbi:MAG: rcc01693 family protein [Hyphomicrobiales bacterium]
MTCAAKERFPWRRVMETGLGGLGLSPSEFWRSTPRELAMAIAGRFGAPIAPMHRGDLERLMERFPDR